MNNRSITCATILVALDSLLPIAQAVSPPPDGGYAGNNTAEGTQALFSRTSGIDNTALGFQALFHNTTGNLNTAEGFRALFANTNGHQNTATGVSALISNTTGDFNTANGVNALNHNIDGSNNTATGVQALFSNINGSDNTASGLDALFNNTSGTQNTATGVQALFSNTGGGSNTAYGYAALSATTAGNANTATGDSALHNNTGGSRNVANGWEAMYRNTLGVENTAIGDETLVLNIMGNYNTAIGSTALHNTTGSSNIGVGHGAGANVTSGSYNVYIGEGLGGMAGEVGHTYISNIASTQQNVSPVTVDLATGLLGHEFSSQRYKEKIKPMSDASEVVFALKPVTYRYKNDIDKSQARDYGLIAEEVAKVDPKLAIRDGKGQIESIRYNAITAMLLNEFLKEHKRVEAQRSKIEEQEATISELKSIAVRHQKGMDLLTAQLKEQAAQIQKVSTQIGISRSTTKVTFNNP
jgi:uncharacterized coiled-coil protein SlyX